MLRKTLAISALSLFLMGTTVAVELEPCIDGGVSADGLTTQTEATEST